MASTNSTHGHIINSPNDHSSVVNVVAWLGIVISVLAIFARMGTKWVVQRKVGWDDGAIIAAFVGSQSRTKKQNRKGGKIVLIGLVRILSGRSCCADRRNIICGISRSRKTYSGPRPFSGQPLPEGMFPLLQSSLLRRH